MLKLSKVFGLRIPKNDLVSIYHKNYILIIYYLGDICSNLGHGHLRENFVPSFLRPTWAYSIGNISLITGNIWKSDMHFEENFITNMPTMNY